MEEFTEKRKMEEVEEIPNNPYAKKWWYYIRKIQNPDTKQYIKTRAVEQMKYYSSTSRELKRKYLECCSTQIVAGAAIPVLAVISDGSVLFKVLISAFAVTVTGLGLWLHYINAENLWPLYRRRKNKIETFLMFYFNRANQFNGLSDEEADRKIIELIEKENGHGRHF